MAPIVAIALGVVTLGICMATVPLDSLTHGQALAGRWPAR